MRDCDADSTEPIHLMARAEQRQVIARFAAALEVLNVGVVVCDEEGHEVYRNAAASGVGRATTGDVLAERATAELIAAARQGSSVERSLELFSPVRRQLTIRAYPIAEEGVPLGALAVIEDVSDRLRVDAMRRDFVANVSHELKTPVGALSLLAETLDGEDDPATVALLAGRVGAEVERLGRIINDLLDLSRIEADEGRSGEPVAIGKMLCEAVEPLRSFARSHDIELAIDEVAPAVAVSGDKRDLASAVANLVDNAIKYSPIGSLVRVRVTTDRGSVCIDVIDQGIGIPSRDRERIFERFYRVDRARSRQTGGTGLGLAIVRHVAANHGGEVTVQSEEGAGSTFTLRLPLAPMDAAPAPSGPVRSYEADGGAADDAGVGAAAVVPLHARSREA